MLLANVSVVDASVFVIAALACLVGALGIVLSRNTVHAALSLVLTLFGIAVLFIEVVLFLFVIMFLGVDRTEDITTEPLAGQRPLAVVLGVVTSAVLITLMATASWSTGTPHQAGKLGNAYQNVSDLGRSVFTTYLFAFEATAALLVIAVVGAVTLARRSGHATADGQLQTEAFEPFNGSGGGAA